MIAWHFHNGISLRDGTAIPAVGEWLEFHGELQPGGAGLHGCARLADALHFARGTMLCQVELAGQMVDAGDKIVATRRRILRQKDARMWAEDCFNALLRNYIPAVCEGPAKDWVDRANRIQRLGRVTARLSDAIDCLAKAHARAAMPVGFNLYEYFAEEDRQWQFLSTCLEHEAQKFLYETN